MLRFDQIVFGPIKSRRLGSSLGVNLLPANGKLCNFDCIYCECGWNEDGRCDNEMPDSKAVAQALEQKLSECREQGIRIDSITFSGNGEPTINPDFPAIVDVTLELRNRLCPSAVISVLSNATMLHKEAVVEALKKVDNPILKMDAVDRRGAELINRPQGDWQFVKLMEGMKKFNGQFILQTMFLSSDEFDTADIVGKWMDAVRELKPRRVMIYTLDRETPKKGLKKYSAEDMALLVQPLVEEGFDIQIKG